MNRERHSNVPAAAEFALVHETADAGAVSVIAVRGELDLFTAPELRARLQRHLEPSQPSHLVIDLTGCSFLDASGCHALLNAGRRLANVRRRLVLVNTHAANMRIFSVMGFDELFAIVATRDEAVAVLGQPSRA